MSEFKHEIAKAERLAARSRQTDKRIKLALLALVLLLAALAIVSIVLAVNNAQLSAENADYAAAQQIEKKTLGEDGFNALCKPENLKGKAAEGEACRKLAEAASEPAKTVAPEQGQDGKDGRDGRSPTAEEIRAAVTKYCAENRCQGADGKTPSAADVAKAVAAKCADGSCRGPSGTNGQNAPPVTTAQLVSAVGTYCSTGVCVGAQGKPGPPVAAEQIKAALDAFCANGACKGADGKDGTNGTDGVDGATGPAPESITFTDRTGTTYTCTPDPPGSATYTCASSSPITGVTP